MATLLLGAGKARGVGVGAICRGRVGRGRGGAGGQGRWEVEEISVLRVAGWWEGGWGRSSQWSRARKSGCD